MKTGKKAILRAGFVLALMLLLSGQQTWANYLRVTNVSYVQAAGTVTFDLQWDNSWRVDAMGAPFNWDAAWTFVKWRECGAPASDPWVHGKIDPNGATNSFGTLAPHAEGFPGGFYPDSNGVMLRRPANGIFPSAGPTSITFTLANFPATGDYDVRVFGIEMVYITEGEFLIGNSSAESFRFHSGNNPILITSEAAQTITSSASSTNSSVALAAAFPKGHGAFYMMKYEISQGQYAEFLNTIPSTAQPIRFLMNGVTSLFNNDRNRLNNTAAPPDIYWSDRPDRAQNHLSWADVAAYLDWSALRPFTELEYEKAARGQAGAIPFEYSWGTPNITQAQQLSTPEDGTETVLTANANCHYGNVAITGGDGGRGPVRVGIFATPTTSTREATGAGYYGVMELTGNVIEQCINVSNQTCATCAVPYDAQVGDGYLDAGGFANVANWPVNTGAIQGRALRGGGWSLGTGNSYLAYRGQAFTTSQSRIDYYGGRGAR